LGKLMQSKERSFRRMNRLLKVGDRMVLGRHVLYTLVLALTASCGSAPNGVITVDREIVLSVGWNGGDHQVIVKTLDGGFVIAGGAGAAWATRVSSTGTVVWEYLDHGESSGQSDFRGALTMPDDSTLLCGAKSESKEKGADRLGYLAHIDPTGKVLTEETMYPNADKRFSLAGFAKCVSWGDGIALVGSGLGDAGAVGWLMKLDAHGKQEWERVEPALGGFDAIETQDHDVVTIMQGPGSVFDHTVARVDSTGTTIARRVIQTNEIGLVRTVNPSNDVYVATHDLKGSKLLTLDRQLHDTRPGRALDTIFFAGSSAYLYADNSLAVFGTAEESGNVVTAAIAHIDSHSKQDAVHEFRPFGVSGKIEDAVLVSADKFVSVRQSSDRPGVILNWVSIK
jgi:hypothetical protein